MGTHTQLKMSDGFELSAYLAEPQGTPLGAVVVIQEIFGVNSHIRSVADTYAEAGYLAIAPALFDRLERNVELGYTQQDMVAGVDLARKRTDFARAVEDVNNSAAAARDKLKAAGAPVKVACVGYCWGGVVSAGAGFTSSPSVDCAVSYYGTGTVQFATKTPSVPMMFHFGDQDHTIPMSEIEAMKAAWPGAIVHVYEAQHGFNCDHRGSYQEASRNVALGRSLAFFKANL